MYKSHRLTLAIALVTLLPAGLSAQKYENDKYTKEADKYIGLAMTRSDVTARKEQYHKALDVLKTGMTAAPDNGKIWFTAGVVYVGLERFSEADEAFDKALAMNPKIAEEIDAERSSGWLQAFTTGAALMDKNELDAALTIFEGAEALYNKRPEGQLNIASIYAAKGDAEKAEQYFRAAAASSQGDLYATQDTAIQRTWREYVELSNLNIAQVRASKGNDAFGAKDYDAAAAAYRSALEINPHSRDYLMNLVQAKYSKVMDLEDAIKADTTKLAQLKPELVRLYAEILADVPKVREFDPMNPNMLLIQSDVVRHEGELKGGDPTVARQKAFAMQQQADALPFEVTELALKRGEGTVTVGGKILNRKLAAGAPVTLKVTLFGLKGEVLGEITTTTNAGAPDAAVPFEGTTNVSGLVAGWKYVVAP